MKPRLHFHHNDFYFGLLVLLLRSFCACWLCALCSCWYFSLGLLLLDVSFLFLHFFYVVVLSLLLGVSYCCFCHAILFALPLFSHYSYALLLFTLPTPFSVIPHIVDTLVLPLFSCCHSFRIALLALLFLSHCYSPHVALLALSHLLHFRHLLISLCCSFHITTVDPFALLLLCFVWLIWYFLCPCHVEVKVQRFDTN
jgi:hypothetical protein